MSRESVILEGRTFSEAAFNSTCTVRRATGATTRDPVTLVDVPVLSVVLAGLRCKVKAGGTQSNAVQVPGQTVVLSSMELHVPMSAVGVLTDDLVTIDTVDSVSGDPDLVGKVLRITGPFLQSAATARRFSVEVVS